MSQSSVVSSPSAPSCRGADVLLEVLRSERVRYIFGNPGTTELPLMAALGAAPDIRYVLGLQEASVVAMADGYAVASGQPGVVNLHTAGGLGHAMGAILNARVANTPLVITAGQQDTRHMLADPLLYGDLVRIAGPAVKWAHEISDADQIPVLVRRAFHDCAAAPSGPVFLSLPMDVMAQTTTVGPSEVSTIDRAAVAGSLDRLADLLAAIAPGRLAVVAGDEIWPARADAETVALAETLGAPVFGSSWPAHIPFPTAHPLWAGNLVPKASEMRGQLAPFEAILALGGKSAIAVLYSEGSAVPPGCQLYQLSADAGDLGRTHPTALSCVGDIRASLRALIPILAQRMRRHADAVAQRMREAGQAAEARRRALEARRDAELGDGAITPFMAAAEVTRAIGPGVPILDEAAATMQAVRAWLHSASARQYSFCRGGALGWGMPAAVGASLGLDREPVVSLAGDGAALYSPQALWTAAHEQLPVTFVVLNNREYNILKKSMRATPDGLAPRANRMVGMDLTDPPLDFLALAASMGVAARRLERAADIAPAVEAAIASGVTNLVEIPITSAE